MLAVSEEAKYGDLIFKPLSLTFLLIWQIGVLHSGKKGPRLGKDMPQLSKEGPQLGNRGFPIGQRGAPSGQRGAPIAQS